jgi:hypothetical protein
VMSVRICTDTAAAGGYISTRVGPPVGRPLPGTSRDCRSGLHAGAPRRLNDAIGGRVKGVAARVRRNSLLLTPGDF